MLNMMLCMAIWSLGQYSQPNQSPAREACVGDAFCDEWNRILSGMNEHFLSLKYAQYASHTNFWFSNLTLSHTRSNFIYTQYDFNGQPVYHEYYAILAESTNTAADNAVIQKMAQIMQSCSMPGYVKKPGQGLGMFTDDPDEEARYLQTHVWSNATSGGEISLKTFFDVTIQQQRVALIFKTPHRTDFLPARSTPSAQLVKVTFVNRLSDAIQGYWLDMEGREVYYFSVKTNEQMVMDTYAGHVWRLKSAASQKLLKTIVVDRNTSLVELK